MKIRLWIAAATPPKIRLHGWRRLVLCIVPACWALSAAPVGPDVVIYGATPGGIVTAVGAARAGLQVTLVHHHAHIGGMMSNGLGVLDTIYDGKRAPLFDEVHARIVKHYRDKYGEGSTQHRLSQWPARSEARRPTYEPHVAELVFERMLAEQKAITVVREHYPVAARRDGRRVATVTFRKMDGEAERTFAAPSFVDASYEGDLAAVAGAEMTIGRESRATYGEPHAGKIFLKTIYVTETKDYFPTALRTEGLNLRGFRATSGPILAGSTGAGDAAVQAYNFRLCWTRDAANQRGPVARPEHYDRRKFLEVRDRWGIGGTVPNEKSSWNAPLLVGGNFDYPAGDWPTRHAIARRHKDFAIGLLWFLQHDAEVPERVRAEAKNWALPKDEFTDNGGFPWEMYVREARRLVGRSVFTQHDGMAAAGMKRAPVKADSIAITEWPMDSHSCTLATTGDSDHEGKVLLTEESRPGQIGFATLLPKEIDNLLVTGAISSSHVGWGALRLEPVWMHVGESAAHALVLARRSGVAVADLSPAALQRDLVARGVMLSFFNDFDMGAPTPEQCAAQYFGPRGFFPDYDARLAEPLTRAVAEIWANPGSDPNETARRVVAAGGGGPAITAREFAALAGRAWPAAPAGTLTRGAACDWLFATRP